MGMEPDGRREGGQGPKLPGGAHWCQRPMMLLAAVMATRLLVGLLSIAAALPVAFAGSGDAAPALLAGIATVAISALAGLLFCWRLQEIRRRRGVDRPLGWRIGPLFWAGGALVLILGWLGFWPQVQVQPLFAAIGFLDLLAQAFTVVLLLALLFPVLEHRFGLIRGTLALCAAEALLSVVLGFARYGVNALLLAAQGMDSYHGIVAGDLLYSLLPHSAGAAAGAALAVAAYHTASRQVPGSWLMAAALRGLMWLSANAFVARLMEGRRISRPILDLLIQPTFFLAVLALALLLLAALQRWKSWKDFSGSAKRLADTMITMGDDR